MYMCSKNTYLSEEADELKSKADTIWAKLTLPSGNKLYIESIYHPHTTNMESPPEIKKNLEKAASFDKQTVWVGGDFNLPDIEWKDLSKVQVKENSKNTEIHQYCIDHITDRGLVQLVNQPTRGENTLDLLLTNKPSTIYRTEVCPGISDHDIVYAEATTTPLKEHQTPRNVYLFKKADYDSMKRESNYLLNDFINKHQKSMDINQMWEEFKNHIHKLLEKYIPQRTIKHQHGYPWITTELRRMIRKRDRLYNKIKKMGNTKMRNDYKHLKHLVQKETRKSYWDYISNIIAPDDKPNPEKFFSFLKATRKETTGVPPLKHQGKTSKDTIDKANALNNQFQSVFTEDSENILP